VAAVAAATIGRMEIVDNFINYLLDHGKITAAVVLAVIVLAAVLFKRLRDRRDSAGGQTAYTAQGGQTTQVSNVRSRHDVTVSPTQRNG
jgi:hypothetical protein